MEPAFNLYSQNAKKLKVQMMAKDEILGKMSDVYPEWKNFNYSEKIQALIVGFDSVKIL